MSRKRLRNHLQNLALVLLTLSALFLLSRLSLLQNIRLPAQTLFSTAPSPGGPEEDALPAFARTTTRCRPSPRCFRRRWAPRD